MSATLGTFLKELEPSLSIAMFETLHDCAEESSNRTRFSPGTATGWHDARGAHREQA
jgi:hypothetical protein